jgi:signal transduction histidine kinase
MSDAVCACSSAAAVRLQRLSTLALVAASVAHDLNNLLSVVLTNASELAATHPDPERHLRAREIEAAAERATRLVKELLALGRPCDPCVQRLDLAELVASIQPLLRRLAGADVSLRFSQSEGEHLVRTDRMQMEQVLINLVTNARDAMDGRGLLSVDLRATGSGERRSVVLSVSDSGCGMDEATRQRLFEPFFTTKGDRGHGLGLAIVRKIVDEHGGTISVETAAGAGTSIHVVLPSASSGADS